MTITNKFLGAREKLFEGVKASLLSGDARDEGVPFVVVGESGAANAFEKSSELYTIKVVRTSFPSYIESSTAGGLEAICGGKREFKSAATKSRGTK